MSEYKSILVALGTDDEHQYILQRAFDLASNNTLVQLIHVVEPFPYMDVSQGSALDINDHALATAEKTLSALGRQFSVEKQCLHVELGRPAAVVKQKAADLQSDLIVVGRHQRHGVKRMLGSTSNAILHYGKCDVLVVHIAD